MKSGSCTSRDVAAPGAAPGDVAVVSTQAGVAKTTVIYATGVLVPDTVAIRICNLKKRGKMAAITGLPLRILTFG